MIYSTNRTTSLGTEILGDVNESYFGIGAMSFMEESAHDELAIFEAAIKSDIDEVLIGESADELSALNEGFVQTAATKIKEMMKKFIDWLASVTRSAYAKLSQLLVRDNDKFASMARKQIIKMKNKDKFVYKGKYLSGLNDSFLDMKESQDIKKDFDDLFNGKSAEAVKAKLEADKEAAEKLSVEDALKEVVKETENGGIDLVEKQIKILEKLSKKSMKDIKKSMDKARKDASDIAKKADKMAREAKEEEKEEANAKAQAAALYKVVTQKNITFAMSLIKAEAKIARAVVAKAMGATPKNEGAEYDEELNMFMIEAADYEYDEALEEMSKGKECCDSDDDDEE